MPEVFQFVFCLKNFPLKGLYKFIFYAICVTYPAHFILLGLIILLIVGKLYKPQSYPMRFSAPFITSSKV